MMEKQRLHRVYYKMEPLGLDDTNTNTLEAIYRKLSRDYLGFFSNVSKGYTTGGIKAEADSIVKNIKQTLQILSDAIDKRSISKDDATDLDNRIEEINQSRDFIIQEALKNKRLKSRLQNISEKTGISPGALNITKEVVKTGVSEARRKPVRTAAKSAWRALEGPREIGKQAIKTGITAVAGPFAPLLTTGYGALKGILGLGHRAGRAIYNQRQETKREQLAAQLRPMSTQLSKEQLQYIARLRQTGSQIGRYSRPIYHREKESKGLTKRLSDLFKRQPEKISKESEVEPPFVDKYYRTAERQKRGNRLVSRIAETTKKKRIPEATRKINKDKAIEPLLYFFDKKAENAKWTREVLKWIKDNAKESKKRGKSLSRFFSGLSSLKLAGLAIGVGHAIYQFYRLKDAAEELINADKRRKESADNLLAAQENWINHIKRVGIEAAAEKAGKTPRQLAIEIASREQRANVEQWASRPWWQKSLSAYSRLPAIGPLQKVVQKITGDIGQKEVEIKPLYKRVQEIENMRLIKPGITTSQPSPQMAEFMNSIEKLRNSVLGLSDSIKQDKYQPAIRGTGLGNIWDSGDPYINNRSNGRLELSE